MGHMTPNEKAVVTATPDEILSFWIDDTGPEGWYAGGDALDATIRERFAASWKAAKAHGTIGWSPSPRASLAAIILLDQFPRNMFRDDPRAFSTDGMARARAKHDIDQNWDLRIEGPARQFFYLPLMHSECLVDQERCVRLFKERLPEQEDSLIHAKAHRDVIRRFGRFPHRNAALGRRSTAHETAFLDEGGYPSVVNALRDAA